MPDVQISIVRNFVGILSGTGENRNWQRINSTMNPGPWLISYLDSHLEVETPEAGDSRSRRLQKSETTEAGDSRGRSVRSSSQGPVQAPAILPAGSWCSTGVLEALCPQGVPQAPERSQRVSQNGCVGRLYHQPSSAHDLPLSTCRRKWSLLMPVSGGPGACAPADLKTSRVPPLICYVFGAPSPLPLFVLMNFQLFVFRTRCLKIE